MKKKIYLLILLFILFDFAACNTEAKQLDNNAQTEREKQNEQSNQTVELTEEELNQVKEYLKENYPKMNIDGSTSLIPLHQALDENFAPEKEDVMHSKTVDALEKFILGEADILLSVDYSDELLEEAKARGVDVQKKAVTKEAFVFLINKNNPVKNLSTEQIKDIYSGKITNWSEVGGDDAPIRAYQRNRDSGPQMRMLKFMADTPLIQEDVKYISIMGSIFENLEHYDRGKYSIAYDMYTFTENQYIRSDVAMLSVDGVTPADETVFSGSYPISIENYIFYDSDKPAAKEFAENLYLYLMSGEGQKLISGSGYINMNTYLEVNKTVGRPFDEYGYGGIGFYNEAKGEFYDLGKNGELLIFKSYADYVLRGTDYVYNTKARVFVNRVLAMGMIAEEDYGVQLVDGILITRDTPPLLDPEPESFFKYRYDGKYYSYFEYLIDEDKYRLRAESMRHFDYGMREEFRDGFSDYIGQFVPDISIEITEGELENLYMKEIGYVDPWQEKIELKYFMPFEKEAAGIQAKAYLNDNYDKMNIDGSTSMLPLHQALDGTFSALGQDAWHNKTVDAFEKFMSGEADILLSVDYSDELLEKAKANGMAVQKKEITREAFVFLINKDNPVKSLSIQQIKDIYSGKITNWAEVGGDDAPIRAYQRNADSGSQMQMIKFMGNTPLVQEDAEYLSAMGYVVETIADYDEGKYSIAYNMYTFTEKQYMNSAVTLLEADGVRPDDRTVFNETYPICIRNYIFYDAAKPEVKEFAESLHSYLMGTEGQELISRSGYVNLNMELSVNKDIDKPYELDYSETEIGFYNEEKGEYYDVSEDGRLLIFDSYVDYVLHDTDYEDNVNARRFVDRAFNSGMRDSGTARYYEGVIALDPWADASFDGEDFFNFRYMGKYYSDFKYLIDENKYVLTAAEKENFDMYLNSGYLNGFSDYMEGYVPDAIIEITEENLSDVFVRSEDFVDTTQEKIELIYIRPF